VGKTISEVGTIEDKMTPVEMLAVAAVTAGVGAAATITMRNISRHSHPKRNVPKPNPIPKKKEPSDIADKYQQLAEDYKNKKLSVSEALDKFKQIRVETNMPEDDNSSIDRMEAVKNIIEGIKASYPDAKKLKIDIDFDFAESGDSQDNELCPVVKIEIER
jgi:hypothetical protein